MALLKNTHVLNDAVYSATTECSGADFKPANATGNGEVYGQGYFVGLVSGIMSSLDCNLVTALRSLKESRHFAKLNPNCIPVAWHSFFVIEDGLVKAVR